MPDSDSTVDPDPRTPRIPKVEETYFGKLYLSDPEAQKRHIEMVQKLRDAGQEEDPRPKELATCGELVDIAAEDAHYGDTTVARQFDEQLERTIDARVRAILGNTTAGNMS